MPELVTLDFIRNGRTRAHHAHVPAQHIEELRQLVETGLAQCASQPRHSIISAQLVSWPAFVSEIRIRLAFDELFLKLPMRCVIRAGAHRAEFVEEKNAPVHSDALLLVKDRAA